MLENNWQPHRGHDLSRMDSLSKRKALRLLILRPLLVGSGRNHSRKLNASLWWELDDDRRPNIRLAADFETSAVQLDEGLCEW